MLIIQKPCLLFIQERLDFLGFVKFESYCFIKKNYLFLHEILGSEENFTVFSARLDFRMHVCHNPTMHFEQDQTNRTDSYVILYVR